jgi:SAM-dependent methyltransferase
LLNFEEAPDCYAVEVPPQVPAESRAASESEIRAQYEIEKRFATRLRAASATERPKLYASLYDELFRNVESHPQVIRKRCGTAETGVQLALLERYLTPGTVFLEIGAGDCSLALAVAERVDRVYAIEVSAEITTTAPRCKNIDILITDGLSVPVPTGSVTLAYSNQVFEHLHPDDGFNHLSQIYTALAPGGRYVCITPNRLTGPHDISKYFDTVATGLHLREYTASELARLMRCAGFERAEAWATRKGFSLRAPWAAVRATEGAVALLPGKARTRVGRKLPLRVVLGCYVVGVKEAIRPRRRAR